MRASGGSVTLAGLDRKLPEVQRLQGSGASVFFHPLSTELFSAGREFHESDPLHHAPMEAFCD